MSAQRTLDVAQSLYERHKLLSYPRTDSRHLSADVEKTLGPVVQAVAARYPGLVAPGTGQRPLGPALRRRRQGHRPPRHHPHRDARRRRAHRRRAPHLRSRLPPPPRGLARRSRLRGHHRHHRRRLHGRRQAHGRSLRELRHRHRAPGLEGARHRRREEAPRAAKKPDDEEDAPAEGDLPGGLAKGQPARVLSAEALAKRTRPPPRYTEGTLLTAMETAGRALEEKELSDAMKDSGLGTPATRAAIIETLLKREYVIRSGKVLEATDKGLSLVDVVHPDVKSPAMTGEWEAKLRRVQRGEYALGCVHGGDRALRGGRGGEGEGGAGVPPGAAFPQTSPPAGVPSRAAFPQTSPPQPPSPWPGPSSSSESRLPRLPRPERGGGVRGLRADRLPTSDLAGLLQSVFGFASFRPYQEAVCRAAATGATSCW